MKKKTKRNYNRVSAYCWWILYRLLEGIKEDYL